MRIPFVRPVVLVLVLLTSLALPACRPKLTPQEPAPKFVVAIPTYPGFALPFLAEAKGLFKGVDVELKRIDDAAVINSGLIRGDIDACFTSTDAFVLAASQGVQAVAVLLSDESRGADGIVVKPAINGLAELKGKRVAANLGWPGHFFLLYNLKQAGIPFAEVPITNMDADKAGAAFVSGQLDAAVTWEPWLTTATSGGKGKVLLSTAQKPGVIVDPMLVSTRSLAAKRAAVAAFVKGYYKALAAYQQDGQASTEVMAKALGLPPSDFAAMTKGFRFIDASEATNLLRPEGAITKLFAQAAGIWREAGVIESDVPSVGRTTDEFAREYVAGQQ